MNKQRDLYKEIIELWRKEIETSEVVEIPEGFLKNLSEYMLHERRSNSLRERQNIATILKEKELEIVSMILKDLFEIREEKIRYYFLMKKEKISLESSDDYFLLDKIHETIQELSRSIENILHGSFVKEEKLLKKIRRIGIVKKEIPKYVDEDGRAYGPFKVGDIVSLPQREFAILMSQGYLEEIKIYKWLK
ncbi:hypothetical protein DRN93_01065 [archaeon]|nr:MAG: hypothetical protein DRN93_01065 [archaeon]